MQIIDPNELFKTNKGVVVPIEVRPGAVAHTTVTREDVKEAYLKNVTMGLAFRWTLSQVS